MGGILVHEFATLDGVIDAPTWTASFGFHPKMGEAIGAVTSRCSAILLGRLFASAAWPHLSLELGLEAGSRTTTRRADGVGFSQRQLFADAAAQ